jgi:hypothetical protein
MFAHTWAGQEDTMDLQQLHQRTGVPLRRLRYCLDHALVPDLYIQGTPDEAGRPRKFAPDVGFGIVCAAELLKLGLAHERIRGFLKGLLGIELCGKGGTKPALAAVLEQSYAAEALLGDGLNVRIVVEELEYDSGWVVPGNPAKPDRSYRPLSIISLNIGQIRDRVFGIQNSS